MEPVTSRASIEPAMVTTGMAALRRRWKRTMCSSRSPLIGRSARSRSGGPPARWPWYAARSGPSGARPGRWWEGPTRWWWPIPAGRGRPPPRVYWRRDEDQLEERGQGECGQRHPQHARSRSRPSRPASGGGARRRGPAAGPAATARTNARPHRTSEVGRAPGRRSSATSYRSVVVPDPEVALEQVCRARRGTGWGAAGRGRAPRSGARRAPAASCRPSRFHGLPGGGVHDRERHDRGPQDDGDHPQQPADRCSRSDADPPAY